MRLTSIWKTALPMARVCRTSMERVSGSRAGIAGIVSPIMKARAGRLRANSTAAVWLTLACPPVAVVGIKGGEEGIGPRHVLGLAFLCAP